MNLAEQAQIAQDHADARRWRAMTWEQELTREQHEMFIEVAILQDNGYPGVGIGNPKKAQIDEAADRLADALGIE